ncbi:hypothetical protein AALD01_01385 [Oscillospiraceae bacterium 21-37]|uniref:hypothetical protein n=1 Tax=unclassified Neglectibacter TaxID=2632164 RepID=UPI0014121571|nr:MULTISPECIES: hypothetical protein [unclassified Neglectibacter]
MSQTTLLLYHVLFRNARACLPKIPAFSRFLLHFPPYGSKKAPLRPVSRRGAAWGSVVQGLFENRASDGFLNQNAAVSRRKPQERLSPFEDFQQRKRVS